MTRFNKILDSELIIIGLYPPPPGGIGVHIERLFHYLKRENINFHVFNHGYYYDEYVTPTYKSYIWWVKFFIFNFSHKKQIVTKKKLFHFHIFSFFHYPYLLLFSRVITNNILITIHNENFFFYSRLKKIFFLYMIRKIASKMIISVSKKLNDILKSRSINSMFLNAYISIPFKQKTIIKNSRYLYIGTNMWRFTKEQIYRYGIDLIFKLLIERPDKYMLHIYVSDDSKSINLNSIDNDLYPSNAKTENIKVIFGRSLIEYIGNYDIFIRPNRSDGFGVSILEALNLKIPVLASDTCIRPDGCITFKTGSYQSFIKQLELIEDPKNKFVFPQNIGNGDKLIGLYKEFM